MPDAPDDPALIALGAAVSDGAPVDWERVELGLEYQDIANLSGRPSAAAVRIAVSRALVRLAAEMGHDRQS